MFAFRLLAAIAVAAFAASSADAADRYYLAPGAGDGTILYDRPLSFVLARCYGLVDGTIRAAHKTKQIPPARLSDMLNALGGELIDVAKKDRSLDIKTETFRPADADDQGIPEDTGAPAALYVYYDDAETAVEGSKGATDLQPCVGVLADIRANRNVGAARERIFPQGDGANEPIVLALAYCTGRVFTNDWDGGYLDEKELTQDRAVMAAALIAAAKRDRGLTLNQSDIEKGSMPPALQNAFGIGVDSLAIAAGRPDFQDVADQEFPEVWEDCQDVITANGK